MLQDGHLVFKMAAIHGFSVVLLIEVSHMLSYDTATCLHYYRGASLASTCPKRLHLEYMPLVNNLTNMTAMICVYSFQS